MSRSVWKGPFQEKKILKLTIKPRKRLQIWSRASIISSTFIKKLVFIHTGNNFRKLFITRNHVGYKFGEFTNTRAFQKKAEKRKNKLTKKKNE